MSVGAGSGMYITLDVNALVVHHLRAPKGQGIYVGRPSQWGNPHMVGWCVTCRRTHTRDEAIRLYEQHLDKSPKLLAALPELRGQVLRCWCAPAPCHAHVLARRAGGG